MQVLKRSLSSSQAPQEKDPPKQLPVETVETRSNRVASCPPKVVSKVKPLSARDILKAPMTLEEAQHKFNAFCESPGISSNKLDRAKLLVAFEACFNSLSKNKKVCSLSSPYAARVDWSASNKLESSIMASIYVAKESLKKGLLKHIGELLSKYLAELLKIRIITKTVAIATPFWQSTTLDECPYFDLEVASCLRDTLYNRSAQLLEQYKNWLANAGVLVTQETSNSIYSSYNNILQALNSFFSMDPTMERVVLFYIKEQVVQFESLINSLADDCIFSVTNPLYYSKIR